MLNKTIYEDGNGGQLYIESNDIATTDSLYVLAYLAMFGGNREADTKPSSDVVELNFDWWGNDKDKSSFTWINSKTERTLQGLALNSQAVEKVKQAVKSDLSFLSGYGELTIDVSITSVNRLKINITLNQNENVSLIWDSTRQEVIKKL